MDLECCSKQASSRYGLTETSAASARTQSQDPQAAGTIGGPQPLNEMKLTDVPELGYHATDKPNPRGEVSKNDLSARSPIDQFSPSDLHPR